MTRRQRKVHVLLWLVLGPLAIIGLVVAISTRPAVPVQQGPLPGVDQPAADLKPKADRGAEG